MIEAILYFVLLAIGITILVKSSQIFTDSAEKFGKFLGLSTFTIGVVIVSAGTSLPELFSGFVSVIKNSSEILIGNVFGSNIANILWILGIAAIFSKKLDLKKTDFKLENFFFLFSLVFLLFSIIDGKFTFIAGIFGILFMISYLTLIFFKNKKGIFSLETGKNIRTHEFLISLLFLISSAFLLYLGARLTVFSVSSIANFFEVGKEVIAISILAFGTTLPEFMVTLTSSLRGKNEIAIGNILGSNIFNIFVILSLPSFFGNILVPQRIILFGIPILFFSTLLCFFFLFNKRLSKIEGITLLIFYILFLIGNFLYK